MPKKKPSLFLLLDVHSGTDFDGPDFAVVELTLADAKGLLARVETTKKLKAADHEVLRVSYWDGAADYFQSDDIEDDLTDVDGKEVSWGDGVFVLDHLPVKAPENCIRVECSQIKVSDDDVFWTTIPKHTDITVETSLVEINVILDIVKRLEAI